MRSLLTAAVFVLLVTPARADTFLFDWSFQTGDRALISERATATLTPIAPPPGLAFFPPDAGVFDLAWTWEGNRLGGVVVDGQQSGPRSGFTVPNARLTGDGTFELTGGVHQTTWEIGRGDTFTLSDDGSSFRIDLDAGILARGIATLHGTGTRQTVQASEPATLLLIGSVLAGAARMRQRRR
jgi:hypothetical protein